MLDTIQQQQWISLQAVIRIERASSTGDDIVVTDEFNQQTMFHTIRQQQVKAGGLPNYALADFIAPKDSGVTDYLGGFAVCAHWKTEQVIRDMEAAHDDYSAILARALADRLAEALAEYVHQQVRRTYWGMRPEMRELRKTSSVKSTRASDLRRVILPARTTQKSAPCWTG